MHTPTIIVLLVEDDEDARCIAELALARDPAIEVISCATAGEAVQVAMTHTSKIDVVLTDMLLPDRHGRELIGILRGAPATARSAIVAFTALVPMGDPGRFSGFGADDVIVKPFDAVKLSNDIWNFRRRKAGQLTSQSPRHHAPSH